jgi:hypothetical protein
LKNSVTDLEEFVASIIKFTQPGCGPDDHKSLQSVYKTMSNISYAALSKSKMIEKLKSEADAMLKNRGYSPNIVRSPFVESGKYPFLL